MNTYIEKIKLIAIPNKYTRYYCNIISKALERPQDRKILKAMVGYIESHHILPKSFNLGGEKDKDNLVFLTAKEHFIVHLCATKMFVSKLKNKMVFAFHQLRSCNQYQDRYVSSRLYAKIKPEFKVFVRLYKEADVKLIHEIDTEEIEKLKSEGWSLKTTPEFSALGSRMKGKKHSVETKRKIGLAHKGKPKLKLRGRPTPQSKIDKMKSTAIKNKIENPKAYSERMEKQSKVMKEQFAKGERNVSGKNNPMFGKTQTENAKQIIAEKQRDYHQKLKSDEETYKKYLEGRSKVMTECWNNPERHIRAKIYNSKCFQRYGITTQEYYNKNIQPLLYMGFLPTSIEKYELVHFKKGYIKKLIWEYGTENDKKQFDINKDRAAGANHSYIKFLKNQYDKYFKDKTEEQINEVLALFSPSSK